MHQKDFIYQKTVFILLSSQSSVFFTHFFTNFKKIFFSFFVRFPAFFKVFKGKSRAFFMLFRVSKNANFFLQFSLAFFP